MFSDIKDLFLDWVKHHKFFWRTEVVLFAICVISNVFSIFALHISFLQFLEGVGFALLFLIAIFLIWFGASLLSKNNDEYTLSNVQQGCAIGTLILGVIIIFVIVTMFSMQSQFMIYGK